MALTSPHKPYCVRGKVVTITAVLDIAYIVHACCVKEKGILSRELFRMDSKKTQVAELSYHRGG